MCVVTVPVSIEKSLAAAAMTRRIRPRPGAAAKFKVIATVTHGSVPAERARRDVITSDGGF